MIQPDTSLSREAVRRFSEQFGLCAGALLCGAGIRRKWRSTDKSEFVEVKRWMTGIILKLNETLSS